MTDWATARKLCKQGGGDLIVIDSLTEQNYIKSKNVMKQQESRRANGTAVSGVVIHLN